MSQVLRRPGQIEVRPLAYLRLLGWFWLVLAPLMVLAGCALLAAAFNALGLMLLVFGAMGFALSRLGFMWVRCDAEGVTRRVFGTRFYSRDAIATLEVTSVGGIGASRAEIVVQLKNGGQVPLDATLIVRSGPEHAELRALITEMLAILRLSTPSTG